MTRCVLIWNLNKPIYTDTEFKLPSKVFVTIFSMSNYLLSFCYFCIKKIILYIISKYAYNMTVAIEPSVKTLKSVCMKSLCVCHITDIRVWDKQKVVWSSSRTDLASYYLLGWSYHPPYVVLLWSPRPMSCVKLLYQIAQYSLCCYQL